MPAHLLNSTALWELYRKYADAKRLGWSTPGSRTKDNQTIAVNRAEVLRVIDTASYADHLFKECFNLEMLLGAIAESTPHFSLSGPLEGFRKGWTGEQITTFTETVVDAETIEAAQNAFLEKGQLGDIEEAILYILRVQMDSSHKDTVLAALFCRLSKGRPASEGQLTCGNCLHDVEVPPVIARQGSKLFCSVCGQRLL